MRAHEAGNTTARLGQFIAGAVPPAAARARAAAAVLDTIGVALAGAAEPAGRMVQHVVAAEGGQACPVFGTALRAGACGAALANGTAAHALDFDDMSFVSLAHPSAPLVSAVLAAAELAGASGREVLDAYVIGFELESRFGRTMNPRHYRRGWHCTSTLGALGAAAAVSRLLRLDAKCAGQAPSIAASQASGLKAQFGTMVKPLHGGLAARNGLLAALLAQRGMAGSDAAIEGPQGFLAAMDSEHPDPSPEMVDLGVRWEILDTGITAKLYPACGATHPSLDAILALRRNERFSAPDVERIDIVVDSMTPAVLMYDRPATGLEAKFSMPFCIAAAIAHGRLEIETFEAERLNDLEVASLMPRIAMHADAALDGCGRPLSQSRITVRLRGGRTLTAAASGARGDPDQPATSEELAAKFLTCARRTIDAASAERALALLQRIEEVDDVRSVTVLLTGGRLCETAAQTHANTPASSMRHARLRIIGLSE